MRSPERLSRANKARWRSRSPVTSSGCDAVAARGARRDRPRRKDAMRVAARCGAPPSARSPIPTSTRTRASARFSWTSGRTPASRCVSRAVRGLGERAGGGGSRATGSRSRTTCACCCARDASGYSREARRNASPRSTRTLRLPTIPIPTNPSSPPPRDPTRCSVASRPSRRTLINAQTEAEETASFPRMRRPTTRTRRATTPNSILGRARRSSSSPTPLTSRRGARGAGPSFPGPLASPGRCIERCRGSTTRARPTARGRSRTSRNPNPGRAPPP
mmetsp:Transcript_6185/g.23893  ORF Transcript_6185/g.23893 Transcript_6185/m.23893 type:complete len:276 (-) Transcript_6185:1125-1952(-)